MWGGGFSPLCLGLQAVHCAGQCLNGALDITELLLERITGWGEWSGLLGRDTQDELEYTTGIHA